MRNTFWIYLMMRFPLLADAFLNKSLPDAVHEKIGAALACKRYDRELDRARPSLAILPLLTLLCRPCFRSK